MLKVELHTHTADDPVDRISHTATELIDRAATRGYTALAITLHQVQRDVTRLRDYARERGIVLINGVERTIEGAHVLLLNFPKESVDIDTFAELARLRQRHRGLVIAPHPFYPATTCLRSRLERHTHLFDAVEYNAMYTRWVNFNRAAMRWAHRHGKPVVGNCDVHVLRQLGSTFSLVDADAHPDAICEAIRDGRVELRTRPLTAADAAGVLTAMALADVAQRFRRLNPQRAAYRRHARDYRHGDEEQRDAERGGASRRQAAARPDLAVERQERGAGTAAEENADADLDERTREQARDNP